MIADPNNNGTLPDDHTALRDARRRQRNHDLETSTRPLPPLTGAMQPFRYMSLIGAIGLVLLFIVALFTYAPRVGAAERPVTESVEITTINSDAGFYTIRLADGRIALVLPATKKTPALTTGPATFSPATKELRQGKAVYRVKWIRKAVTK